MCGGRYLSIYFLDCIATNRSSQFYAISSHIQHAVLHFTNIYYGNVYANSETENKIFETLLTEPMPAHIPLTFDQMREETKKKQMRKHELHMNCSKLKRSENKNYRFNAILTNLMHCGDEQNECKRNKIPRRTEEKCTSYAEVRYAAHTHMGGIVVCASVSVSSHDEWICWVSEWVGEGTSVCIRIHRYHSSCWRE